MGLDPRQLRDLIVRPVLLALDLPGGEVAERLVMGTGAHESDGFRFIRQKGGGPALGLWQMEPITFDDNWNRASGALRGKVLATAGGPLVSAARLVWDLRFAAAMCRVHYYLRSFKMPATATAEELAAIWKKHYNTIKGAGKPEDFLRHYRESVAPLYDGEEP